LVVTKALPLNATRRSVLLLCVAVCLGAWFRCAALDAGGYAEDEIDIVRAVASYERLDFSANAEHPMLAKLAAFGSVRAAARWNASPLASRLHLSRISPEQALRLPSALVGGVLTTVAIYLLCLELFPGSGIAGWAALLWALDVNAISINRTAKEDTFFVFFFVAAVWLYARAKREGAHAPGTRWYTASGATFGLMLACKYMPHYYGLHALYVRITDPNPGSNRPRKVPFYAAMGLAFLSMNFAVLLPASWVRLSQYLSGRTPIHTGYLFAHKLYVNSITATPGGVPVTFYADFLATKVPVLLLAAFAIGIVQLVRRRTERGFVFARIFLVLVLLPYSVLGAKFVRYMLPLFVIVDIIAASGIVWILDFVRQGRRAMDRPWLVPATIALFIGVPLSAVLAARPFFGLTENAIGMALSAPGYMFTDDELNDVGVREAVRVVAAVAGSGATIASDASSVVEEYLKLEGRTDIQSVSLSRDGLPAPARETWVIAQDGHTYFENQALLDQLQRQPPFREWRAAGVVTARLFAMAPGAAAARSAAGRMSGAP
jgi:hypothetical protein